MYLREMGTVPLLTREGEVEIAKRIEKGKRTVLKAISRAPLVVNEIRQYLTPLSDPGLNLKHFVVFTEDEITQEVLDYADEQGAEVWQYTFAMRGTNPKLQRYYSGLYTWATGAQGTIRWAYTNMEEAMVA